MSGEADDSPTLELADTREEYCELLLRVRDKAMARGFSFVEVMLAMGRMAECMLERLVLRRWEDGRGGGDAERLDLVGWWEEQEERMAMAQKIGVATGGGGSAAPSLNGGVRTPAAEPGGGVMLARGPVTTLSTAALPKGIEMGIGAPPPTMGYKPNTKVNPLLGFIATLPVGGWVKFETEEYSRRTVACALTATKKMMPTAEFERRFSLDGKCVVIVRKK